MEVWKICLPVKRIKKLSLFSVCKRRLGEKFIPVSAYLHGENLIIGTPLIKKKKKREKKHKTIQ